MTVKRIPLVGDITARGQAAFGEGLGGSFVDQSFRNVIFDSYGGNEVYVKPWSNWTTYAVPASPTGTGTAVISWTGFDTTTTVFAYGTTNSTIYEQATDKGTITGQTYHITQTSVSSLPCVAMTSTDSTAWYLMSNAMTVAFTGDTTNTSPTVINISPNTTLLYAGMAISGSGIPAGTRILSIDSNTQITMTANATATAATVSITPTPIAKILDADYPGNNSLTVVGAMQFLKGYAYVMTSNGRIYNSDVNSVTSWQASNYITVTDPNGIGVGCVRYGDYIVGFTRQRQEFFYVAGNAAGSILSIVPNTAKDYGASSGRAIVRINGTVAWAGRSKETGVGIYIFEGTTPKKISTHVVDARLQQVAGVVALYRMAHQGRIFLCVQFATTTNSMAAYDFATNRWCFIDTPALFNGTDILQDKTVSTTVYANSTVAVASGQSYLLKNRSDYQQMTIVTAPIDFGTNNKKRMTRLSLVCDQADSAANAAVSFSDDDYVSFGTARNIDISKMHPKIHRCGTFIKRAIKIVWPNAGSRSNGTDAPRAKALEVEYEVLKT